MVLSLVIVCLCFSSPFRVLAFAFFRIRILLCVDALVFGRHMFVCGYARAVATVVDVGMAAAGVPSCGSGQGQGTSRQDKTA